MLLRANKVVALWLEVTHGLHPFNLYVWVWRCSEKPRKYSNYAHYNLKDKSVDAHTNADQLSKIGQFNGMPSNSLGGTNVITIQNQIQWNLTLRELFVRENLSL